MSDTPVDPAASAAADPPAEPTPAPDAVPAVEETASQPDTAPALDLPDAPPAPIGQDATLRAAVAEQNADLQPGQTVTTTTAGEAVVTGVPAPDGVPTAAATLAESGHVSAVATPIGVVAVGFEVDAQGVSRVVVTTFPSDPDFQVHSDVVVLRQNAG